MTRPIASESIVYATVNWGRAKHVGQVAQSMTTARDQLARLGQRVVLFCQEIDEGDKTKPSDHTLIRRIFTRGRNWRKAHMWGRDPILTRGLKRRRRRWFRAAPGVKRQSPARQVVEQIIRTTTGPDVAVIGGHYPAGAYNGSRPPAIRARLVAGYDRMLGIHQSRVKAHHRAGRHVVWGMDVNQRRFPRLHRDEVELAHHGPDYLRVVPAEGWSWVLEDDGEIPMQIERLHRLLWAAGHFEKET